MRRPGVHAGLQRGTIAGRMTWTFLWMMLALKIPIAALIYLVWWAIHQEPDPVSEEGGSAVPRPDPRRHPRPPRPRRPRRGPNHGSTAPLPPPRVRSVRVRARQLGR